MKKVIDSDNLVKQEQHWETMLSSRQDMFGEKQSFSATEAANFFKKEGVSNILELGAGQGRDTLFFAQSGFYIKALDYSQSGVKCIQDKANAIGLAHLITAKRHDIRNPLPYKDNTFDACYSHMLFCMALTTNELEFLSQEIRRILKPGGFNVYTVRHTGDSDFGSGIHRGEDMYESGGFIVHFFSKEKVKHLAKGYEIIAVDEFEEGELPRKLFQVTLKKEE